MNENSKQPISRWDLIDALAKLYVIGDPSIGQVDDSIQIDPEKKLRHYGQALKQHHFGEARH